MPPWTEGLVFLIAPFETDRKMRVTQRILKEECEALGLALQRADDVVGARPILDDIVQLIYEAEFIICDLTYERPNVYYELGFAQAAGNSPVDIVLIARCNLMLAAGCLSEVRNRRPIQCTSEDLHSRFVEEGLRYDPPYEYEPKSPYDKAGHTRRKAVRLLASAWRSEETRLWLKSAAENHEDGIVRAAAVQELARGWKEHAETLPCLKQRTRSAEETAVRLTAAQELARGWKEDPETLAILKELARSHEDRIVRTIVVLEVALALKDDAEALAILKERARCDTDILVGITAVQALARGWTHDVASFRREKRLTNS